MALDWQGFYAILDPEYCKTSPVETAEAILRAKPTALQLRWKNASDRERFELGVALRQRCQAMNVPFVMNDRVDLALLTKADGVHLGQDDLPIEEARRFFDGPIGVSTHSLEQALEAAPAADLLGFGPVFATASKAEADPVVGVEALARVCAAVSIPVVAIGGIDAERAQDAFGAGAAMVAAISAVCASPDPQAAAARFIEAGT